MSFQITARRALRWVRTSVRQPDDEVAEALYVAEGLREAARQCRQEQAAPHERLIGGAEMIERLCRARSRS